MKMRFLVSMVAVLAVVAGVAALGWKWHLDRQAHLYSWYLHVTPVEGEPSVVQVDMRQADEPIHESVSNALSAMFPETVEEPGSYPLGRCEVRWDTFTLPPFEVNKPLFLLHDPDAEQPFALGTEETPDLLGRHGSIAAIHAAECPKLIERMRTYYEVRLKNRGMAVPERE